MKEDSYIMEAIDLLMHYSKPMPKPSVWIRILDIVFTVLYLALFGFGIYKVVEWLS